MHNHQNAKTNEAKTQVDIARLKYLLPRLAGMWSHLERQRGGGTGMRGMGEKQIEVDRRIVKHRLSTLEKRLLQIEKEREVQRKKREEILKVSIVGYTNAGKSSLMNHLANSHLLAEDRLFATLDAQVKNLSPKSRSRILLIDTVGFIKKLPADLVASFKSTLEEIREADLIMHVVDIANPNHEEHILVTERTLIDLGCQKKPKMLVFNKMDKLEDPKMAKAWAKKYSDLFDEVAFTSIQDETAIVDLREQIIGFFNRRFQTWDILIPYERPDLTAKIHEYCFVEKTDFLEKGTFFRIKTIDHYAGLLKLKDFQLHPSSHKETPQKIPGVKN